MFEVAEGSSVSIENQTFPKRLGELAGKKVIPAEDLAKRVRAAVDARKNKEFLIIARTDAKTSLGLNEAIRRLNIHVENGADMFQSGN